MEKLDQSLGANFKVPRQLVVDASVKPEDIAAVVESEPSLPTSKGACSVHSVQHERRATGN